MSNNTTFTRKHFFIDRKLQGRYMLTFLIPMLVMLVFMILTLYFASQAIFSTTTRIMKQDVENTIAVKLQDQPNPSVEQYETLIQKLRHNVREFASSNELKRELIGNLLWVFGIGLLLVVIQMVLLTIFFSHKLAGPIFRFEKVCHNIIAGKYTDHIKLRKGDQLQNLANLMNEAVRVTNERITSLEARNGTNGAEKKCSEMEK
ncbi:MAG: hypothetical protein ACLFQB_03075 [Chitinispirillaceae bacterium]